MIKNGIPAQISSFIAALHIKKNSLTQAYKAGQIKKQNYKTVQTINMNQIKYDK